MSTHAASDRNGPPCGEAAAGAATHRLDGTETSVPDEITCEKCRAEVAHLLTCSPCRQRYFDHRGYESNSDLREAAARGDMPPELVSSLVSQLLGLPQGLVDVMMVSNGPGGPRMQMLNGGSPTGRMTGRELAKSAREMLMDFGPRKELREARLLGGDMVHKATIKKNRGDAMNQRAGQAAKQAYPDVEVLHSGEKLILPEGMDLDQAVDALQRRKMEFEKYVGVRHEFDMTPPEGALALVGVLKELYGFVNSTTSPGPWGSIKLPMFRAIETDVGETEEAPWGRVNVPGIEGWIGTSFEFKGGFPRFVLVGEVAGKHKAAVERIAERMRETGRRLYAGKAIRASFPEPRPGEELGLDDFLPTFIALPDDVDEESLVLSQNVEFEIQTSIFTPIECTEMLREQGIPVGRGVLLEGPYGVGKTLTATVTALLCKRHGWTFIHIEDPRQLPKARILARQCQPAVIFAEDIDTALSDPNKRDEEINKILNNTDGIESKNDEIITILTTNRVTTITKAMLRPGRMNAVIFMTNPDADAARRLVMKRVGRQLVRGSDLTRVGELLDGKMPAMIEEVVTRSRLAGIRRSRREGGSFYITAEDLEKAAVSMEKHMALLNPPPVDGRSNEEKAAAVIGAALTEGLDRLGHRLIEGQRPTNGNGSSKMDLPALSTGAQQSASEPAVPVA